VKLVHAADLHLGCSIRGLERCAEAPVGAACRATGRALSALVDLCIDEGAALLVLSGDLVDASARDHKVGLFFVREMLRLRDAAIRVFSVRGNHDAANRIVPSLLLPDNVVELGLDGPETVVVDQLGVALHGQSYRDRATTENLVSGYPRPIPEAVNIGVLHTSADGRVGHDTYAPCTVRLLRELGYDYWALGHVHEREVLCRDPAVVFPGNTQGRNMRERGPKGATIVSVEGSRVAGFEHRSLDVVRFCACEVDVSAAETFDDILGLVRSSLATLVDKGGEGRALAVRLVLEGAPGIGVLVSCSPERCLHWIREVARAVDEARLWIEQVWVRAGAPVFTEWMVCPSGTTLGHPGMNAGAATEFLGAPRHECRGSNRAV
jgi:DNA repair protein SbcD/Mre11